MRKVDDRRSKMEDRDSQSSILDPRPEVFITDDPRVIDELHAAGEKELAIRNGKEYVFKNVGARFIAPEGEDNA